VVIQKGKDWGTPGVLPPAAPVAHSNAELRALVREGARVIGVTGGDLCRTLNGSGSMSMVFPIDLCRLTAPGVDELFVAHCVARNGWLRGPITAVMNAQFIGSWDVAPRSHPNDGVVDVLVISMALGDRLKARKRLASGTHVPHPLIAQRRMSTGEFHFGRPTKILLDGEHVTTPTDFTITVEPDALTIVI
jgi:YegS C-terminal NAD kinase beta sandwich-like domain